MLQNTLSWHTLIARVKKEHTDIKPFSFKFKQLIIAAAEKEDLSKQQVNEVGLWLGLKLYPIPLGVPDTWKYKLCKTYLSQRYTNPLDSTEYLVVKPGCPGYQPYIIHRTIDGYADARWFYEVCPQLALIVKNSSIGFPFGKKFNEAVHMMFQEKGMTPGQVQAINFFFEKYVPGIEGICTTCYKVQLPKSGAGECWLYRDDKAYEVRLSAAKPQASYPSQQREYVSQKILDEKKEPIHALWDANKCEIRYDQDMVQAATHIPWEIYDFNKFNIGMPKCKCKVKEF